MTSKHLSYSFLYSAVRIFEVFFPSSHSSLTSSPYDVESDWESSDWLFFLPSLLSDYWGKDCRQCIQRTRCLCSLWNSNFNNRALHVAQHPSEGRLDWEWFWERGAMLWISDLKRIIVLQMVTSQFPMMFGIPWFCKEDTFANTFQVSHLRVLYWELESLTFESPSHKMTLQSRGHSR